VEQHIDLQVGTLELVAPLQVDKMVGMVERSGDTNSLLLHYNHLDSLQERGKYCLASVAEVQVVLALQEIDIHLPALGKSPTSLESVLRVSQPVKT